MSTENDAAYFLRREKEERNAACVAADPSSRDAHLALAERYADRAALITEGHFPDSPRAASQLRYARPT